MRRVRILEAAAKEATAAANWYERERAGLGVEFAQAVNAALDLLEDEIVPLASMPDEAGKKGAKRLVLKRFPYDIVVRDAVPLEVCRCLLRVPDEIHF